MVKPPYDFTYCDYCDKRVAVHPSTGELVPHGTKPNGKFLFCEGVGTEPEYVIDGRIRAEGNPWAPDAYTKWS